MEHKSKVNWRVAHTSRISFFAQFWFIVVMCVNGENFQMKFAMFTWRLSVLMAAIRRICKWKMKRHSSDNRSCCWEIVKFIENKKFVAIIITLRSAREISARCRKRIEVKKRLRCIIMYTHSNYSVRSFVGIKCWDMISSSSLALRKGRQFSTYRICTQVSCSTKSSRWKNLQNLNFPQKSSNIIIVLKLRCFYLVFQLDSALHLSSFLHINCSYIHAHANRSLYNEY